VQPAEALRLVVEDPRYLALADEALVQRPGHYPVLVLDEDGPALDRGRYFLLAVAIGDDERPIRGRTIVGGPNSQNCAVNYCKAPEFQAWVREQGFDELRDQEDNAAEYVYRECRVASRVWLDACPAAAAAWMALKSEFLQSGWGQQWATRK